MFTSLLYNVEKKNQHFYFTFVQCTWFLLFVFVLPNNLVE